jgi:hypothetical protein
MIEYVKTDKGIEVWQKTLMETISFAEWEKTIADREKIIAGFDEKKYLADLQLGVDSLSAVHRR